MACARGSLWGARCMQRLLVHVLADRSGLSQAAAREESARFAGDRQTRTSSRFGRVRPRCRGGLVPAHATQLIAVARSHLATEASGRSGGVVAVLSLRTDRLPQARRHIRTDRSRNQSREACTGSATRGLSAGRRQDAERLGDRLCLNLRACWISNGCLPLRPAADHAPRSQDYLTA